MTERKVEYEVQYTLTDIHDTYLNAPIFALPSLNECAYLNFGEIALPPSTEWLSTWKEKTYCKEQGKRAAFAFCYRPINCLNCFDPIGSTDHFPCETVLAQEHHRLA